jgi:MFS family permease
MRGILRRQPGLRRLWIGETTSTLGTRIDTVVLPLLAVTTLHASAFVVSAITAAAWLPWLVLGLVDRRRRRSLMIRCDIVSALLFATIPVAGALGILTSAQLIAVAFAAGVASVLFTTAYSVYLVDLVTDPADRPAANSLLQGSASAAQVGGPGVAGLLVQLVGAVTAVLADSLSFVVSAFYLWRTRAEETPASVEERLPLRKEIADGLRFLRHDRLLRPLVLFGGTANLALVGYQALLVVFLVRDVGVGAGTVGLLLTLVSCGGLVGAMVGNRVAGWLGSGRALLLTKAGACPFALLIPLAGHGWRLGFVVLGGLGVGTGIVAGNVISSSFWQSYVPHEYLARSNASTNVFNYGTMPIGALMAGALAAWLGVPDAMWVMTALLPATAAFLIFSPLRRIRVLPTGAPAPDGEVFAGVTVGAGGGGE